MNQILDNAHSYASYKNAENTLKKIFGDEEIKYAIFAQADGRFTPVVFAFHNEYNTLLRKCENSGFKFGVMSH